MALVGTVGGAPPANAYSGFEWEAQRLLNDMALAQRAVSILKTGALPVMLQKRVFAYNGDGLSVNIYKGPTYTGGTPDAVYNKSGASEAVLLTQLLTGFTLTADGTQVAATMTLLGPDSVVGGGSALTGFGGSRLLLPNTSYLLTFSSLSATQDVTARLEFFEGVLDYSRTI